MSSDSHITSFFIISCPKISCNSNTAIGPLQEYPSFPFLTLIEMNYVSSNGVSSAHFKQRLHSTNKLTVDTKNLLDGSLRSTYTKVGEICLLRHTEPKLARVMCVGVPVSWSHDGDDPFEVKEDWPIRPI